MIDITNPRMEDFARAGGLRPMPRETYNLFILPGADMSAGPTIDMGAFPSLEEATERSSVYKARFYVRVTNTLTGAVVRKFYQVRRKSKGERRWSDHQSKIVHDTYPEHLFDLLGEVQ